MMAKITAMNLSTKLMTHSANFFRLNGDALSKNRFNFKSISVFNLSSNSVGDRGNFHTSSNLNEVKGLNEFFDSKENLGKQEVKVGRSWRKEELRIKSNVDLHKLWYVLLKERNMLLTMEHAAKEEYKLFPNPERIDKVEDSMENLEDVVRERNRAYMLLETGETGERPSGTVVDSFGRVVNRRFSEHSVPDHLHTRVTRRPTMMNPGQTLFFRLLREKEQSQNYKRLLKMKNYVANIFRKFPNADMEEMKAKFPEIDVEKVRRSEAARGNHSQNVF